VDWAIRLTRAGLLIALINACTTGLVTAAVWLHRYDRRATRPVVTSILAAIVLAFGAQVAVGILGFVIGDIAIDLVVIGLVSALLLLYTRHVIHDALLVEGAEHEIGPDAPCPECHRMVPAMRFCPACGAARAAASKRGRRQVAAKA
jgi:hypothetical protein